MVVRAREDVPRLEYSSHFNIISALLTIGIMSIVNDRNFPSFAKLPDENDLDMDYYAEVKPGRYSPYRHWCFVGEIEDVTDFMRVRVTVSHHRHHHHIPVFYLH